MGFSCRMFYGLPIDFIQRVLRVVPQDAAFQVGLEFRLLIKDSALPAGRAFFFLIDPLEHVDEKHSQTVTHFFAIAVRHVFEILLQMEIIEFAKPSVADEFRHRVEPGRLVRFIQRG